MNNQQSYGIPGLEGWNKPRHPGIRNLIEERSPFSPDAHDTKEVVVRNLIILFRIVRLLDDVRGCPDGPKNIAQLFSRTGGTTLAARVHHLWNDIIDARRRWHKKMAKLTKKLNKKRVGQFEDSIIDPLQGTRDERCLLELIDIVAKSVQIHGNSYGYVSQQAKDDAKEVMRDWKTAVRADPQDLVRHGLRGHDSDSSESEVDMEDFIDDSIQPHEEAWFAPPPGTSPAPGDRRETRPRAQSQPQESRSTRLLGELPIDSGVGSRATDKEEETGGGEESAAAVAAATETGGDDEDDEYRSLFRTPPPPPPATDNEARSGANEAVPSPPATPEPAEKPGETELGSASSSDSNMFVTP